MPTFPWLITDDSPIWGWPVPRYVIQIDTPDGPVEWDDEASDPDDAQTYAAERLLRDYPELGTTTEDVASRVGDAEIVPRYA
jgi:hypothetical protein